MMGVGLGVGGGRCGDIGELVEGRVGKGEVGSWNVGMRRSCFVVGVFWLCLLD